MDSMQEGRCFGDDVRRVAEGVLKPEVLKPGQLSSLESLVACGEVTEAARKTAEGVDIKVIEGEFKDNPEKARVLYILLGFSPGRYEQALARGWN